MIKFSDEHVWLAMPDVAQMSPATVGITEHAQDTLGDIVFVELPELGRLIEVGSVAAVVESVKAAADVYMPATGKVVEVNEALRADPSLVNTQPMGDGWLFKIQPMQPSELDMLMDESRYAEFLKTL